MAEWKVWHMCSNILLLVLRLLILPCILCHGWLINNKNGAIFTSRSQKLRPVVLILCMILVPYLYIQLTFPVRYIFKHSNTSTACIIPHPDPFDASILKFVWHPDPLICDTSELPVIYVDDNGQLQFNQSAISTLNLDRSSIKCAYSILNRHLDDDHVIFSKQANFVPPIHVNADFMRVSCELNDGNVIFNRMLTNIRSVNRTVPVQDESRDRLSVIIFGLDSVSRSAAIRKLPKTFRFLTEDLKSYDFKGYMKNGENTLPNLVPFLTGRRVWTDELPIRNYSAEPFDSFPLLWKNFSAQGYATFYAEDSAQIGTFNYLTKGFVNSPTDHYMRPFMIEVEEEKGRINNAVKLFLESRSIQIDKGSTLCYKDKPMHVLQTDYLKQFINHYTRKRKFAFSFMNEISHEYPNFLEFADETILELLKWMKSEGHLENSAFLLFSDHGARIDKIRNTFVGRIEDRMPVFELVLPDHIKSKYPDLDRNLRINSDRLTTHYDTYQTLADILHQRLDKPTLFMFNYQLRGISLFREVPLNRSCIDALIPENYCACHTMVPVDFQTDPLVPILTTHIVEALNNKFRDFEQCARLELHKVQDVRQIVHGLQHAETENKGISLFQFFQPEQKPDKKYFVVIETKPGFGIFETTVTFSMDSMVKIAGEPVRVNKYGNQSVCVNEKLLRPYCFCR